MLSARFRSTQLYAQQLLADDDYTFQQQIQVRETRPSNTDKRLSSF